MLKYYNAALPKVTFTDREAVAILGLSEADLHEIKFNNGYIRTENDLNYFVEPYSFSEKRAMKDTAESDEFDQKTAHTA